MHWTHSRRPPCTEKVPEPKELREESLDWKTSSPGPPNAKEVLLYAFLVVTTRSSVADLNKWVAEIRRLSPPFVSEGTAGLPSDWKPAGSKMPKIYEPLAHVFSNAMEYTPARLDPVCGAMAAWQGPGRQVGLTLQRLKDYKSRMPAAVKKGGPPRWKTPEVLFAVADLVHAHGAQMWTLLLESLSNPPHLLLRRLSTS